MDIELVVLDSCEIGDSIGYAFVFDAGIDSIDIEVFSNDSTWIINPNNLGFEYEIRLRGDSSVYEYIFTSTTDQFCADTISIQTIDCTPIICDPDFTFEIQGLTITFTDNSTTSEPITDQSWTINDVISIDDLSTFNFTVDSIGMYSVCHQIVTDSCSNEICEDILVGDPCSLITSLFSYEMINDGFQFTNLSTGIIDEYTYSFGDGIFANNPNPFHVYEASGTYEACLVVRQNEFNCAVEYCDSIVVVISNVFTPVESTLSIYPNPILENIDELFIEYSGQSNLTKNSIRVVNSVGGTVSTTNLNQIGNNTFTLSFKTALEKGVYFLIVKEGQKLITKKVVVL